MRLYSCKQVSIIFTSLLGSIVFTEFDENDMIELSRNNDSSGLKKGAQGHNARFLTHDKSGKSVLKLMQGSPALKTIATIIKADEETGLGAGVLLVTSLTDGEVSTGTDAFFTKPPDRAYGKETGVREIQITIGDLDFS